MYILSATEVSSKSCVVVRGESGSQKWARSFESLSSTEQESVEELKIRKNGHEQSTRLGQVGGGNVYVVKEAHCHWCLRVKRCLESKE